MTLLRKVTSGLLGSALLALTAVAARAQEMGLDPPSELATQSLRPYWHVFIAYAIVLVLVIGWAAAIARKLAEVEARLGE